MKRHNEHVHETHPHIIQIHSKTGGYRKTTKK